MFPFLVSVYYLLLFIEIFLERALDTFKIHFRFETVFRHILDEEMTQFRHNLDGGYLNILLLSYNNFVYLVIIE